jgi:hypothetical protein
VIEALFFDWAVAAYLAGLFDVCDVFVVGGEHEVCFASAVGVVSPVFVCIGLVRFVLLGHCFGASCWYACTGGPVYGSNFAVMLSALVRMFLACCGVGLFLGSRACIAPSAYGAPEPIAYIPLLSDVQE